MDDKKPGWKNFTEEIEVTGQQLLETINRLIAEGNVRKLNQRRATVRKAHQPVKHAA
jgi:hypothetical protein